MVPRTAATTSATIAEMSMEATTQLPPTKPLRKTKRTTSTPCQGKRAFMTTLTLAIILITAVMQQQTLITITRHANRVMNPPQNNTMTASSCITPLIPHRIFPLKLTHILRKIAMLVSTATKTTEIFIFAPHVVRTYAIASKPSVQPMIVAKTRTIPRNQKN